MRLAAGAGGGGLGMEQRQGLDAGAGTGKGDPGRAAPVRLGDGEGGAFHERGQTILPPAAHLPHQRGGGHRPATAGQLPLQLESYYDSYKALEQVIQSYSFQANKSDLIKIQFLIGRKFQEGARVDLLNDQEPPAVGKRAAIEIFKSVIDNDPVGPYAGAATLAIAYCYKDLNEPQQGLVYCDRVMTEFGMSSELVAKSRILKATLEVMLGKADVPAVREQITQARALAEDAKTAGAAAGASDFAPITDYERDIRELEERQAGKLWESAEFYNKRGSRDSITAYKFTLEQIVIRFPNTTYAQRARRIVGDVKIPPQGNALGKFNLPFIGEKEPNFIVQPNTENHVEVPNVPVPGAAPGGETPAAGVSAAGVTPVAPPVMRPRPAGEQTPQPAPGGHSPTTAQATAPTGPTAATSLEPLAQSAPSTPGAIAQPPRPSSPTPPRGGSTVRPGALGGSAVPAAPTAPTPAVAPIAAPASSIPVPPTTPGAGATPHSAGAPAIPASPTAPAALPHALAPRPGTPPSASSGSSAVPAGIRTTPAAAPENPAAPRAVDSLPPASPAVDPRVQAAQEAAGGMARSAANEAAAKTNNWEFSEDFE